MVGENAGSKLQKAKDLGIEIMDMADFFEMTAGIEIEKDNLSTNDTQIESNPQKTTKEIPLSDAFHDELISLVPMRAAMAEKISNFIKLHSGKANTKLSKKTTMLVYQLSYLTSEDDYVSINKARDLGIPVYTLGHFNRLFLEKTSAKKETN